GSVLALAALLPACGAPLRLDPVEPGETRQLDPEVLELARVKIEAVRADPSNARAHGTLGLLYEANSLWAAAAASFDNASRLDPREALWRYHRSIALREAGETEAANALLAQSARELASLPGVQHRLGQVLLDSGDVEGAWAAFQRALALAPE